LLAAGTAWGEWKAQDFRDHELRRDIARSSSLVAPPSAPPQGLKLLSGIWTAPMPGYAPGFMKSASFGYVMSAMLGTGVIIATFLVIGRVTRPRATSEGLRRP